MTWYETPAGAKVFAGGVLDFGGSAERWVVRKLLDNSGRGHSRPPTRARAPGDARLEPELVRVRARVRFRASSTSST